LKQDLALLTSTHQVSKEIDGGRESGRERLMEVGKEIDGGRERDNWKWVWRECQRERERGSTTKRDE